MAIVADEPQLTKFVHETVDAGPGSADHLGERLLADLRYDRFRRPLLAKICKDQKEARQALFARVEKMVDEIRFHSNVAGQQTRGEQLGKLLLVVNQANCDSLLHAS